MSENQSTSEAKNEMSAQSHTSGLEEQNEEEKDFSDSSTEWEVSDEETESSDSEEETKAKKKRSERSKRQRTRSKNKGTRSKNKGARPLYEVVTDDLLETSATKVYNELLSHHKETLLSIENSYKQAKEKETLYINLLRRIECLTAKVESGTAPLQFAVNSNSTQTVSILPNLTSDNELQGASSQPKGSLNETENIHSGNFTEQNVRIISNLQSDNDLQSSSSQSKQPQDEPMETHSEDSPEPTAQTTSNLTADDDNEVVKRPFNKGHIINGSHIVEMVPIGTGRTFVPRETYDKINWNSYSAATRKLLMALFPRSMLATHSLSGRPSPAFRNKPVKLSLDHRITSDIIAEVVKKCQVLERVVRSIITVKCADECKMLKTRLKKKALAAASARGRP